MKNEGMRLPSVRNNVKKVMGSACVTLITQPKKTLIWTPYADSWGLLQEACPFQLLMMKAGGFFSPM